MVEAVRRPRPTVDQFNRLPDTSSPVDRRVVARPISI
jgi:hypothetical protein